VTGQFIGTMSYISPEQIRGEPLDARTDLYAFGCVAYECLTGVTPFVRQDPAAMLWAHLNDPPPPPSEHHPQLRGADRVIARALAKKPGDRYRSGAHLVAALTEALHVDRQPVSGTATAPGVIPVDASNARRRARAGDAGADVEWASAKSTTVEPLAAALRVFLVDDHEMVRRGVADLLEAEQDLAVVGEASSAAQALTQISAARPDVAVLDMRLPDGNGVELCRELRSRLPDLNCLMLTSFTDEEAMLDAILAGASGYVIKDIKGMDLLSAVRAVGSGHSLLDSRASAAVLNRLRTAARQDRLADLSEQERAVLEFIGKGLTNRQIGQHMALSESRVKACVSQLLAKLGVARRTQAAALAGELHDRARRGTE
jgi:DNA-binding NarL/FixJ family response regulator